MSAEELPQHRHLRFLRIRRTKWLLRFMPRRARFHTYPIVGRFAAFARHRSYLWSFRYAEVRPALYIGSILTLIPIPGQIPSAFLFCLLLRTNFMVMGGLQFVSNPATSIPCLLVTYNIGATVLEVTGFSTRREVDPPPHPTASPAAIPTPLAAGVPSAAVEAEPTPWVDRFYRILGDQLPPRGQHLVAKDWVRLAAHLVAAFVIGATLAGLALGAILDLLWRSLVLPAAKLRAARKPITASVTPHDTPPPLT
jgi:uncharacterized protein (DUF2062 family)